MGHAKLEGGLQLDEIAQNVALAGAVEVDQPAVLVRRYKDVELVEVTVCNSKPNPLRADMLAFLQPVIRVGKLAGDAGEC